MKVGFYECKDFIGKVPVHLQIEYEVTVDAETRDCLITLTTTSNDPDTGTPVSNTSIFKGALTDGGGGLNVMEVC